MLHAVVSSVEHVRFGAGSLVLEEGGAAADSLYVVRDGEVALEHEGETLDVLGPGEAFGFPSLLSRDRPSLDARARGDVTCLRIPREVAERALGTGPGLRFLAVELRERAQLAERTDPGGLQRDIERAGSVGEIAAAGHRLPVAIADLRDEGLSADAAARATAGVVDALTRRALDLAIAELGDPRVPWAWVVFGSVARREPGLAPDQDHTIVWEEGAEHVDEHFARLGRSVTDTLAAAGLEPCPSGVLATSPGWRASFDTWLATLLEPRGLPARTAFLLALALDGRRVAGELPVSAGIRRLARSVRRSDLLWRLARLAEEVRPPIGAFGGLVTERWEDGSRSLDLKRGGLLAVTDLARVAVLRAGVSATSTVERLRLAAGAGGLDPDDARALEAAFEALQEIRLDRQVAAVRAGEPLEPRVDPSTLDPVTRGRLRQSFRVIADVQERLGARVGGSRFG